MTTPNAFQQAAKTLKEHPVEVMEGLALAGAGAMLGHSMGGVATAVLAGSFLGAHHLPSGIGGPETPDMALGAAFAAKLGKWRDSHAQPEPVAPAPVLPTPRAPGT